MNYDASVSKEKANRKARIIWLIFLILLSANYGTDTSDGLYPVQSYIIFLILCWFPFILGEVLLRVKGWATDIYRLVLVIGYGIFYTFLLCTTASPIAFTYILPVISLLVLYKNLINNPIGFFKYEKNSSCLEVALFLSISNLIFFFANQSNCVA